MQHDNNRLIEMAWQDRTPFDIIQYQYGLSENQMVKKMRSLLTPKAFRRWKKRVKGRKTKHLGKIHHKAIRFEGPW